MINCIILDDEPLAIQLLASYTEKIDSLNLLESFTNPLKALSFIGSNEVELIFLDVQMPELNGVQFAKLIPSKTKIIFTTAYPNYAIEGFELNAIDYLVKPISLERFIKSVNRVENNEAPISENITTKNSLFVKTEYRLQRVEFDSILFIKGLGDYAAIETIDGKILTLENMRSLEERLPKELFMRVHKSYIISFTKIEYVERHRIKIAKELIPIGSTHQEKFYTRLNK